MNEILLSIFIVLLQGGLLILGAPLVRGLIRTFKARLQNRKGPPLFQSYLSLRWEIGVKAIFPLLEARPRRIGFKKFL